MTPFGARASIRILADPTCNVVTFSPWKRSAYPITDGFFQYRALKNGKLDRRHFREIMAAAPEAAFGWLQLTKPPPGVVGAEHRFAKRRLEHLSTWKPRQDELSKLRGLVNSKAGREIV